MGNTEIQKAERLPYGDSADEVEQRKALFKQFDMNGNGYLSLAEVDKGIRDVLQIEEVFDAKPVELRAFESAKGKLKSKGTHGDDYISKGEFKFLLIYLRQYYEYWCLFESEDKSHERKITEEEFAAGVPLYAKYGVVVDDPKATFEHIRKKHHEHDKITFTDFCDWAVGQHLKTFEDSNEHEPWN